SPDVAARARDTTTLQFSAHQRALRAAQRAAEPPRVEPPPAPAMPATACSGDEPWMPRSPKTWLRKFRAAGGGGRRTRAGGRRRARRAAEPRRAGPRRAPARPATVCSGDEPWMPRSPKTWLKKFRAAGWWVRLTRAGGPRIDAKGVVAPGKEVVWTIALAAARGDQRLVMLWEFDGEKWGLDDVVHNVRGVLKSTDVKEILDAV